MEKLKTTHVTEANPLTGDALTMHVNMVHEMVQAAVSLEEFTIPLYMCSMYSLVGTHQITSNNKFYQGIWYPGNAITANPAKWVYDKPKYTLKDKIPKYEAGPNPDPNRVLFRHSNNITFNLIYKIFIEEMLHLQMAANLAKILGVEPLFTNEKLIDEQTYAWTVFGKNDDGEYSTIIPYILDLEDTKSYSTRKVKLGPLDENQINLFLAIEQEEEAAMEEVGDLKGIKYFLSVTQIVQYYEDNGKLPLFGSIGYMYKALWTFLHLPVEAEVLGKSAKNLLDYILLTNNTPYPQRELFNLQKPGHPIAEYPGFDTTLHGDVSVYVAKRIEGLINAITEQGEGSSAANSTIPYKSKEEEKPRVAPQAQVSKTALKRNYTSYDDEGKPLDVSPRVGVRGGMTYEIGGITFDSTDQDHDEIFAFIRDTLMNQPDFMTWDQWHGNTPLKNGQRLSNEWTADLIQAADYKNNEFKDKLPDPSEIAAAMKRLKHGGTRENETPSPDQATANYKKLCQVSTGAIWGIIHVLDKYWSAEDGAKTLFPFPAMGGTGD